MISTIGFDDALDAFGVHAIGGVVGGLAVGFFASPQFSVPFGFGKAKGKPIKGVYYGGINDGGNQLAVQIVGILFSAGWAFFVTLAILLAIDKTIGLRVSEEAEEVGLDSSIHGESNTANTGRPTFEKAIESHSIGVAAGEVA